ncbi:pyridine nucleotide-disulfide oxidoreductase [Roseomonas sp. M0104]|uniref:Pyridine nucleotide-disulfide oxidoreductase n=1 Tax=Teichococcus coralli TaxID=2545983 RepID=A0A845B734_9PROT|nr:FAD-dependent oxidoreductase [Pseudoroseomonas coralli]MXP62991.1 pyridine nucleotide-disulfide oxidoreductase [Pseudoroseomonas coralli]
MARAKEPDLTQGVPLSALPDGGMLAGRVGEEMVLLARRGESVFAIGAKCTHYGAPLAEGLMVGETVRCPWHHACFSLRSGEALRAPALAPAARWKVERHGSRLVVREKAAPAPARPPPLGAPGRILILGGGAAGLAAAERLRREGYAGSLTLLSDDADPPYDRPSLSKDFLSGEAGEQDLPLFPERFYADQGIALRLGAAVTRIDATARQVQLEGGESLPFDRLLIATGAEPVRPPIPGAEAPEVLTLRSWRDSRRIIRQAASARHAVLVGASFIALEVAAALRQRGLAVTVVAPDRRPLEKTLGPQLAQAVRQLHEEKGVAFRLGQEVAAIGPGGLRLKDGTAVAADLVLLGTGVRPRTALAEAAGLAVENGILVDAHLQTSAPGIFAAGDVARWPDPHSGGRIRVEHWVVAGRMGQVAALNMLGRRRRFDAVPFFWNRHYHDLNIDYLGHAEEWDAIIAEGRVEEGKALLRYRKGGRDLAVATVDRDLECLAEEAAMEARLPGGMRPQVRAADRRGS